MEKNLRRKKKETVTHRVSQPPTKKSPRRKKTDKSPNVTVHDDTITEDEENQSMQNKTVHDDSITENEENQSMQNETVDDDDERNSSDHEDIKMLPVKKFSKHKKQHKSGSLHVNDRLFLESPIKKPKKVDKSPNVTDFLFISFTIAFFSCCVAAVVLFANDTVTQHYCDPHVRRNCDDFLSNQTKHLYEQYEHQTDKLWVVLYSAASSHVEYQPSPTHPIVIMTYNCHKRPSEEESIYKDISKMYEAVLSPNKKRGFIEINGSEFVGVDPDEVQNQILMAFDTGYKEDGKRVAVIHNFDSLPSCSVLTFHNLCNNDDAPYKDMAIILSVKGDEKHVGVTKNKELEKIISAKFHDKWKDCPDYLPRDKIDAMLSRIANNIVILK